MAIPGLNEDKRTRFLPVIIRCFSLHDHDEATTAGIAEAVVKTKIYGCE